MSDDVRMFVYCDSHKSRAPVTDFIRSGGQWQEDGRKSSMRIAPGQRSGLGIVLTAPENPRADSIRRHHGMAPEHRLYDLRCRGRNPHGDKCARSVAVRADKLFRYLDDRAADGASAVSLSDIGANV